MQTYISFDGEAVRLRIEELGYGLRDPGMSLEAAARAAGLQLRTLYRVLAGARVIPSIADRLESLTGPMPKTIWRTENARVVAQ